MLLALGPSWGSRRGLQCGPIAWELVRNADFLYVQRSLFLISLGWSPKSIITVVTEPCCFNTCEAVVICCHFTFQKVLNNWNAPRSGRPSRGALPVLKGLEFLGVGPGLRVYNLPGGL